jgi:hypothetical protein
LAPTINFTNNNVDVETDEKSQAEKAARTKQNAKSKLAVNTWAFKIKIPNKFAKYYKKNVDMVTVEKNPAEKAAKTKQNAKSKLAINTWALTLKIKTPNKFASCLDWGVRRGKQDAGTGALKSNVDVETTEKDQVVKAVKTKQNAKSELAIYTWANILKHKIPTQFENIKENTEEMVAST